MNDFAKQFPDIAARTAAAKRDVTPLTRNTNNWHCESRLWNLLDAFVDYFPSRYPVDKNERASMYAGARKNNPERSERTGRAADV